MISYLALKIKDYAQFYMLSAGGNPPPTEEEIEEQLREDLIRLQERINSQRIEPEELVKEFQGNLREKAGLEREFVPRIDFGHK